MVISLSPSSPVYLSSAAAALALTASALPLGLAHGDTLDAEARVNGQHGDATGADGLRSPDALAEVTTSTHVSRLSDAQESCQFLAPCGCCR